MTSEVPPGSRGAGPAPWVAIPRSAARRLDARVLDPAKAVRLDGDDALWPTLYAGNRLIVRGLATRSAAGPLAAITAIAERLGYAVVTRRGEGLARLAEQYELGEQL